MLYSENKKISVLLVEDLVGDAKAITKALSYQERCNNLNIITANRLKDSIVILNETPIDVILLDLSLPDAKDIKALVELRSLFLLIPIIIISDYSDDRIIKRAIENGANYFLSKSESGGIVIKKAIDEVLNYKFTNETA